MKNLLKILISFLAFCLFTFAVVTPLNMVGNWYQQFMPNIGGQQINDITFLDSLTGFAISSRNVNPDTASILRTTNGGDNWQVVFSPSPKRFTRIQFINQSTGFVCGGTGSGAPQLYKTTNAGANWFLLSGFGCALWRDMYVLNNDTIWVVDSDGLCGGVFRTTNGGTNWTQQLNLSSQNPSKIYMFNARIGFISNNSSYIRKTTNSGLNWAVVSGDIAFFDMYFDDSLTGWKCDQLMKKTTDGGLNWVNQPIPNGGIILNNHMLEFENVNKDTIWGVGGFTASRGIIYKTTNGGTNWGFQIPDNSINIGRYYQISLINKRNIWAYNISPTGVHTNNSGNDTTYFTSVKQISSEIPEIFSLYQNYPNPFNPVTNIKYQISKNSYVTIKIFDITGKEVSILINEEQMPGTYQTDFNAMHLSSGIYFYSLIVDGFTVNTKKMILVK